MDLNTEALEKLGIHVVTEEERNRVLNASKEYLELMNKLRTEFRNNPPKEQLYTLTVRISDEELDDFQEEIKKLFSDSPMTEQDLIAQLICDLTGYRRSGSDEQMFAKQWLAGVNPQKNEVCSSLFDQETIHEVVYSIALLDWEWRQFSDISEKAGISADQLIECFIRDVAGYRPPGADYGHAALAWMNRMSINF